MITSPARVAEEVRTAGGIQGHLYLPDTPTRAGAVIVLHERYGLVQHTLDLAARLAGDGYVALAPNLFSRWSGDHDALRRGEVRVVLPDAEIASVVAECLDFLAAHARVDPARLALMGVCQSGRYPLIVASQRRDVAACVVFYGASKKADWEVSSLQPVPMERTIADLACPSLFVFGEADHTIALDDVLRVRTALESARQSYRMRVFAAAPHGWLNDTMPGRYRPREAAEAWRMLLAFLDDVFSARWPGDGRVRWEFASDTSTEYDFARNVRLE